jgi:HK97 family phage major capsid protein
MNFAIVLRKARGRFDAFFRNGTNLIVGGESPVGHGSAGSGMLLAVLAVVMAIGMPMLILAIMALTVHVAGDHLGVALLAAPPLLSMPAGIRQKKTDLDNLLKELERGQEEMAKGPIEPKRGEELDQKASEAAVLQDELDRWYRNNDLITKGRQVDSPLLPQNQNRGGGDNHPLSGGPDEVIGYMTLGKAFVESDEYKQLAAQGFPATREIVAPFEASFHTSKTGYGVVAITRKMLEGKAVPTLGAGVIRADRLGDIVRNPERVRLTIRDLVNKSNTTSNSIEYVTVAYTEAADMVAESAVKPESALVYGTGTAPVRTIAVTMPITEQQLQDVPGLQNTIDEELTWDLKRVEERQILWGDGTGQNLLGIFPTPGVTAGRTVGGDTLIDMARRSITDIVLAELEPNGIVMDPLDWETVLLTKATDGNYIWAVVTTENGSRLWGVNVVETSAMREPGTYATNERRMLVGDFRRGATLWDRQQAGVQIGWVNDQFRRNQRTVRAEERLAFGVRRPAAFKYRITQARVA